MYGIRKTLLVQERNDYSEHLSQGEFELDCSMGSNPYGTWPGLKCPEDLFKHIDLYPHSDEPIKEAIADYFAGEVELKSENILLTCGSIGAIMALNRMVLVPGKCVLGIAPQFSAVIDDFVTYEVDYRPVFLKKENNYKFQLDEFLEAMRRNPGAYLYLDNPNNPTGQVITLEQTEKIVSLARELDSFVVMDEAYGDYMEMSQSAAHLIDKYDNLAVMRTFSKGMGAAGIRLGYILAQPGVIGAAAKVNVPFSKNEVADYVARSLLSSGWTESCVKKIVEDKPKVLKALSKIKAAHTSNSVPITMLYVEDTEVDLCQLLEQAGIRAITGVGYDGIGKNTVRLNLHSDVQRLIACLLKAEEMLSR